MVSLNPIKLTMDINSEVLASRSGELGVGVGLTQGVSLPSPQTSGCCFRMWAQEARAPGFSGEADQAQFYVNNLMQKAD